MFGAMDLGVTDDSKRAGHKQAAQIAVTLFAYIAEPVLASTRVLFRHNTDPGREVAPSSEGQSWLGESGQNDKWIFRLTTATWLPRIRRDHDEANAPEPHAGFQGQGGFDCHQGRKDAGRVGSAFRCSPEPN